MSKLNPYKLSDSGVNFVCRHCDQVYYIASPDDFNTHRKRTIREATEFRKHYHVCPWKRNKRKAK